MGNEMLVFSRLIPPSPVRGITYLSSSQLVYAMWRTR